MSRRIIIVTWMFSIDDGEKKLQKVKLSKEIQVIFFLGNGSNTFNVRIQKFSGN